MFPGLMWTFAAVGGPAGVSSVCKHWCGTGDSGEPLATVCVFQPKFGQT